MEKKQPKYKYIAECIKKDISDGKYHSGDRLPVERLLCETYEASRMTIRHALQLLEKNNVVRIDPSRGAYVMDASIKRSKEIVGFTELMQRQGYQTHSKVIRLEKIKPNEKMQQFFMIDEEDDIYLLQRIRYANDMVVAIETSHINAKFCEGLEMFNFEKFSLYDVFHEHYKLEIAYAKDEIRADNIHGDMATTLCGKKSGPALIVHNSGYDSYHNPIEYTESVYNYKLFTYIVISTEASKRYQ